MKKYILIITLILLSLVGYSQSKKLGKLSIRKINKEIAKSNKNNISTIIDFITDTRVDSIHGRIVCFYTLYSYNSILETNKILIEHTFNGVKKLTKEEIFIKNNQVIYYNCYDYSTGNYVEVYFKNYKKMFIKVNGKYCKPEIEILLFFQNYISDYINFIENKYK